MLFLLWFISRLKSAPNFREPSENCYSENPWVDLESNADSKLLGALWQNPSLDPMMLLPPLLPAGALGAIFTARLGDILARDGHEPLASGPPGQLLTLPLPKIHSGTTTHGLWAQGLWHKNSLRDWLMALNTCPRIPVFIKFVNQP